MKLTSKAHSAQELLPRLLLIVSTLPQLIYCRLSREIPQRRQVSNADGAVPSLSGPTAAVSSGGAPQNPPFGNYTTTAASPSTLRPTDPPESSAPELTSTITKVPVTTQVTVTHVVTDEFGRSSTSIDVVPTTTMIPSDDPSLANGGESSGASGVTPQQKKIIIGVVVSIVGVLSIAGIVGVIWRIWFTRRGNEEGHPSRQKTFVPASLSRSSMHTSDGVTYTSSGGADYRKKPTIGGMGPSSNF
ncbi:hypothetical protein TWF696_001176 [Orbilia brochopaga]|uniref:Mid2 domain-containing protein n=1 Tax=Orbilia brochopaga TaxID=3140254 RepID=A0AAV9UAN0_9PEZI